MASHGIRIGSSLLFFSIMIFLVSYARNPKYMILGKWQTTGSTYITGTVEFSKNGVLLMGFDKGRTSQYQYTIVDNNLLKVAHNSTQIINFKIVAISVKQLLLYDGARYLVLRR